MGRALTLKELLAGLRRVHRCFSPHVRRQSGLIWGSMSALFFGVVMRLLEPWPLKFVFDRVIVMKHSHKTMTIPALEVLEPMQVVTIMAVALVVITGLRALADYWNTVGFALIGNRVLSEMRGELY